MKAQTVGPALKQDSIGAWFIEYEGRCIERFGHDQGTALSWIQGYNYAVDLSHATMGLVVRATWK